MILVILGNHIPAGTCMRSFERGRKFLSPLRSNDRLCRTIRAFGAPENLWFLGRAEALSAFNSPASSMRFNCRTRAEVVGIVFINKLFSIAERDCKGTKKFAHMQKNILEWFRYLLTLCFVFLAADGVGPRNVVSVVVNIIILVVWCCSVYSYIVPLIILVSMRTTWHVRVSFR